MTEGDRERLHALFVEELAELSAALNRGLVELEAERQPAARQALIDELFRYAHTLKGAAQVSGERRLAALCHDLEDRFAMLRENPEAADRSVTSELLALVDVISAGGGSEGSVPASPGAAGEAAHDEVEDPPRSPAAAPLLPTEDDTTSPAVEAVTQPAAEMPSMPIGTGERGPDPTVRLRVGKLDGLLEHATDLLLIERSLGGLLEARVPIEDDRFRDVGRRLRHAGADLANTARTLRMAPFATACQGLERLARDVAAAAGKDVRLDVVGGEVELDRPVLDALREPLGHLVRNAVDHGIESPAERESTGKPSQGHIRIGAALRGGRVQVGVRDDGRGVDVAAVRRVTGDPGVELPDEQVLARLFSPGFSTARSVTSTSGRGVGLDAVREAVERIGGTVELDTRLGAGTAVGLVLPLSLSWLRVVLVEVAGHRFALASSAIDRLIRVDAASLTTAEGRERVLTDHGPIPIVSLAAVLGLPDTRKAPERFPAVLATTGGQQIALEVDALVTELEVTVAGLGERVRDVPAALGGALLADREPVVVLSPTSCARIAMDASTLPRTRADSAARRPLHVLLADDSLTTRTLERAILEGAGYEVTAVADGLEALELAELHRYDAVVSDVMMPRMDGVTLCQRLRGSARHADVPIILVTSMASDQDRLRGLEAGASAYLTKQSFDQGELLATIEQLAGAA